MGSGFSSIEDLLQQSGGAQQGAPSLGKTQQVFAKKMKDLSKKDHEVQAERQARAAGVPYINLEKFPISQAALRLVGEEQAIQLQAACFFVNDEEFRIAAVNPFSDAVKALLQTIQEKTLGNGKVYLVSQQSFAHILELYKTLPTITPITKDVQVKAEDLEKVQASVDDFSSLEQLLQKTSTTDLVTFIMGAGLKLHASDIHIEAEAEGIVLRFRLDGILHDAAMLPRESYKQLISRLKLLSSLKINITDKPQDGRFTVKMPEGDIDIRVSTIPTVYGESVVMRLLVQRQTPLTFEELGIVGWSHTVLSEEIRRPNGMIITTGPTGSGKTTTLYSVMHQLNSPDVKIITLEDPVEYKMEGINQSQIDKSRGYTFAKGLKSMLRQDPDIAMVGEIRDLETAEIAIQAALTGHLILSTIHTNNAFGAIPRFLSMGVKPFLLAPALNAVIGQRLVRRLDPEVKIPATLSLEQEKRIQTIIDSMPPALKAEVQNRPMQFFTAPADRTRSGFGYKGRIGIYETVKMTKEIEQHILAGRVSEYEIKEIAVSQGTITMVQDGLLKALDGVTSIEEVFRVIE